MKKVVLKYDRYVGKRLEDEIKKELGIDRRNKDKDVVIIKEDIKLNYIGNGYLYCLLSKKTDRIFVGGLVGDISDILSYVVLTHDIYEFAIRRSEYKDVPVFSTSNPSNTKAYTNRYKISCRTAY